VSEKKGLTYEDAGVSIDTMDAGIKEAKGLIRSTFRPEVLGDIGHFGGLFALNKDKYDEPVLVSSTDSVGTKLKVAFMSGKHNTVGIDIVSHCGNDIVVLGAEPIFFLDYIGTGKLERHIMVQIIEGLSKGCKEVGCALIGGETAELPSFYRAGEYDLVGTIVGVIDRKFIVNGEKVVPGDNIIGLASVGLHTNGYSLARKIIFDVCGYGVLDFIQELGITVGEELLKPHKSYVKSVLNLINKLNQKSDNGSVNFNVKGMAHITGGGLIDNVPRILPDNCCASINLSNWKIPPIFSFMQKRGEVEEMEMHRVFNMGIGMVIVVSPDCTDQAIEELKSTGETVHRIGQIIEGDRKVLFQ
jgi:phosphoribosylformylglycinamidine cyclo-ligase